MSKERFHNPKEDVFFHSEPYRPGQAVMRDEELDKAERGELVPPISRFDKTTGRTEVSDQWHYDENTHIVDMTPGEFVDVINKAKGIDNNQ